jgi:hypothetical protein
MSRPRQQVHTRANFWGLYMGKHDFFFGWKSLYLRAALLGRTEAGLSAVPVQSTVHGLLESLLSLVLGASCRRSLKLIPRRFEKPAYVSA